MEEMEDWLLMSEEDVWEHFFYENESEDDSLLANFMRLFREQSKWRKKKSIDEEEEIKSYYNVSVYRVLPYPPHTKDEKDFFVQRN
ncbi:MAG: hypothetical protein NTZ75_07305 [Euryarchaeota archaeon]|nr:hypothetical protein [Euryarchaeota archaeon]